MKSNHHDTKQNKDSQGRSIANTGAKISLRYRLFFAMYNALWWVVRPIIKRHHRLRDNFPLRLVPDNWPRVQMPRAKKTLWIQAASGGEALIAQNLAHAIGFELAQQCPTPVTLSSTENQYSSKSQSALENHLPCDAKLIPESQLSCERPLLSQSSFDSYPSCKSKSSFESQEQKTTTNVQQPPELELVCTTCTSQGLEVLQKAAKENPFSQLRITPAYFPLDTTHLMEKALCRIAPDAVVLLETEIWPSLLLSVKQKNIPLLIVNGRVTEKSASAYGYFSSFFKKFGPKWIMATKSADAKLFTKIFPHASVENVPNIKFDIAEKLLNVKDLPDIPSPYQLAGVPDRTKAVLLASVREEEEELLLPTVKALTLENTDRDAPLVIIAPRHLHRAKSWVSKLEQNEINALLCSERKNTLPSNKINVIVWDKFGELSALYALCDAVFVGGSFAPLGGQNFLEPLAFGKIPFVGPHLKNFAWTGQSIFHEGLAKKLGEPEELAQAIREVLEKSSSSQDERTVVQQKFSSWLTKKTGGSTIAAKKLLESIQRDNSI